MLGTVAGYQFCTSNPELDIASPFSDNSNDDWIYHPSSRGVWKGSGAEVFPQEEKNSRGVRSIRRNDRDIAHLFGFILDVLLEARFIVILAISS